MGCEHGGAALESAAGLDGAGACSAYRGHAVHAECRGDVRYTRCRGCLGAPPHLAYALTELPGGCTP